MLSETQHKIIQEAIGNASLLDWIKDIEGKLYIHVTDVEKIILGIFDESYINNLVMLKIKQSAVSREKVNK